MERFDPAALRDFASMLLVRSGMEEVHAARVGRTLVEADLLGHGTHGLRLLPRYLRELRTSRLRGAGQPETVADNGNALIWDGGMLAGPSLTMSGIDLLMKRVADFGLVSMVIRRSHHIACLAAYLQRVTDAGHFVLLTATNPGTRSVAPFGGRTGLYASTPVACGIPTEGDPILVDLSLSTTSGNTCRLYREAGQKLPGPWLLDRDGNPSDDPNCLHEAGGTLLPLGGLELGYKGFGLAMIMHALTIGLAGLDNPLPETSGEFVVFILILDPGKFGGRDYFATSMAMFADACRNTAPAAFANGVRMPGDNAMKLRRAAMRAGLEIAPELLAGLRGDAADLGIAFPPARPVLPVV